MQLKTKRTEGKGGWLRVERVQGERRREVKGVKEERRYKTGGEEKGGKGGTEPGEAPVCAS